MFYKEGHLLQPGSNNPMREYITYYTGKILAINNVRALRKVITYWHVRLRSNVEQ